MIDFRSDTVTQPTEAMREAMFRAEVGDDVYEDDPTTKRLEALAADLLGKEAGLFVTSGTMGNQLSLMTHTRRGDEAIVSAESHIVVHEVGAAAVLSGLNLRQLRFENDIFEPKAIEAAIRSEDIHEPPTSLICIENALANGRIVPIENMAAIYKLAQTCGIPVHLDGARIFNAATALQADVKELTRYADSISCCLSKGLAAPVGTVLVGSRAFIRRARKNRKLLGGGMRQNGILAAAGILALTDMTKRLGEDHANARHLAELLVGIPGLHVDPASVEINMVFCTLDWPHKDGLHDWMLARGIKLGGYLGGELRFVTHNDIARADVERVAALMKEYAALA